MAVVISGEREGLLCSSTLEDQGGVCDMAIACSEEKTERGMAASLQ